MTELTVESHPLLSVRSFITELRAPNLQLTTPVAISGLLSMDGIAPLQSSDEIRAQIRDALRTSGFKPTGRSKPASEYLLKAARERTLSSINFAVDFCNAVSLHSGLPISVVDLQRLIAPLRVAVAAAGDAYVFNASGQVMDVGGLICLHDQLGPCANPVKDSQRAKTTGATMTTLSIIWGAASLAPQLNAAAAWYRELLAEHGARTSDVAVIPQ